jgi:hypothetical protein
MVNHIFLRYIFVPNFILYAGKTYVSADAPSDMVEQDELSEITVDEQRYAIHSVKYDDKEDLFEVVHIDTDGSKVLHDCLESFDYIVSEVPELEPHLLKAMANCENAGGYSDRTKPVMCAGAASSRKRKRQTVCLTGDDGFAQSSLGLIKHFHTNRFCFILALMNVVDASPDFVAEFNTKFLAIHNHDGAFTEPKEMIDVCGRMSIQLKKIWKRKEPQTIWHLLRYKEGKYIVQFGVHCISIDCDKKLLYDCAATHILPLTKKSFELRELDVVSNLYLVMDKGRKNKTK